MQLQTPTGASQPPPPAPKPPTCARPRLQAAARLSEALQSGDAIGLVMELGLDPNYAGMGVEPFLRALQEATPPADKEEGDKDRPTPMEE